MNNIHQSIEHIKPVTEAIFYGICGLAMTRDLLVKLACGLKTCGEKGKINEYKQNYHLELVDKVMIEDTKGLENIIKRSEQGEFKEWGTGLKAHVYKNTCIITEILDSKIAEKNKIVKKRTWNGTLFDNNKLNEYDGTIHFHPNHFTKYLAAIDYNIGIEDRGTAKINSINLITFNTSNGIEVIAHNKKYMYIPKNRNDKSILIKADHNQILEYLS